MKISIEELQSAFSLSNVEAVALYGVISGHLPARLFSDVQRWTGRCYNTPSNSELRLCAANQIIQGHGIERIPDTEIDYVNMGDTYIITLLYNHDNDEWSLGSWGDIVESLEDSE